MRRWSMNLLCGLSLLMFLLAMGIWVRSYWRAEQISLDRSTGAGNFAHRWDVALESGVLFRLFRELDSGRWFIEGSYD